VIRSRGTDAPTETGTNDPPPKTGVGRLGSLSRARLLLIGGLLVADVVLATVGIVPAVTDGGGHAKGSGGSGGAVAHPRTCNFPAVADPAKAVKAPPTTVPVSGTVTVAVSTTHRPMTLRLDRVKAPCTVASFVSLAQQKYFDAAPCHRIVTSGIYVLQCGDPTGVVDAVARGGAVTGTGTGTETDGQPRMQMAMSSVVVK
jgi:peptidyl-prolyl cis-trans isomerase B (cyclophilin B)